MNRKQTWDWLCKTALPDDAEHKADQLIRWLQSADFRHHTAAQNILGMFAFDWPDYYTEAFALAVLRRLQDLPNPDERTILSIERLAQQRACSASLKRVQAAARTCLAALNASWDSAHANEILLHGAQTVQAGGEVLLRPAQAGPTVTDEDLLRHSEKP